MQLAISILMAVFAIAVATQAEAQERAGVVTSLEGNVTVTRASLPQPASLKFKDDIFVRDRVTTGKESIARLLLGGRAVVTVREHSTVTITEVPGVATVDVATGRVAVAVAREKMRPGDIVQVRTPNAVAGIRGTVVVAEVLDSSYSVITVLKGTIDVTRLEAGREVGTATIVGGLQRVTIADGAPISTPETVGPAAARRLGQQFRLAPPRAVPQATTAAVNASEMQRAAKDLVTVESRAAAERRPRGGKAVDDDQDDGTPDRGTSSREKWDKVGKPESAPKGRAEVKTNGRAADPVYTVPVPVTALPDTTKSNDKNGRVKGAR